MNTYTLADKLESMDCRRDDKARRVANVAPDTVAEITAEELENGVTLERLDSLNVPVLRYSTQVTIHGKLPAFDVSARPGGYRAVFLNGNGSVGVRFSAIDAEKKELIARVARVSGSGWFTHRNSAGFEICRYFLVRDEADRATQKAATLAALKTVPVGRFYGSAGVFALAYGLGYGVVIGLGAIPAAELWAFIAELFPDVATPAELATREAARQAEEDAKRAQWVKECEEATARRKLAEEERRARFDAFMGQLPAERRLVVCPLSSGSSFKLYLCKPEREDAANPGTFIPAKVRIEKRGASLCYNVDGGKFTTLTKERAARFAEQAMSGRIYGEQPVTVAAPVANGAEPASKAQTFALYLATGKDFRPMGLTREQAHAALSAAAPFRGDKRAGLAAVEKALGLAVA